MKSEEILRKVRRIEAEVETCGDKDLKEFLKYLARRLKIIAGS